MFSLFCGRVSGFVLLLLNFAQANHQNKPKQKQERTKERKKEKKFDFEFEKFATFVCVLIDFDEVCLFCAHLKITTKFQFAHRATNVQFAGLELRQSVAG